MRFRTRAATTSYASSGVSLVVGQNAGNAWLLSFASPAFKLNKGETLPIDVTFDGQAEAGLFATANANNMLTAILPANVARTSQKARPGGRPGRQGYAAVQPDLNRATVERDRDLRSRGQSGRIEQRRRLRKARGRQDQPAGR